MVRWWLYKCEVCGMASFTNSDHGNAWYADCGSCRAWGYHDKMVIHKTVFKDIEEFTKCPPEDVIVFMCKSNKDSTEEQNVSDKQVNEH